MIFIFLSEEIWTLRRCLKKKSKKNLNILMFITSVDFQQFANHLNLKRNVTKVTHVIFFGGVLFCCCNCIIDVIVDVFFNHMDWIDSGANSGGVRHNSLVYTPPPPLHPPSISWYLGPCQYRPEDTEPSERQDKCFETRIRCHRFVKQRSVFNFW